MRSLLNECHERSSLHREFSRYVRSLFESSNTPLWRSAKHWLHIVGHSEGGACIQGSQAANHTHNLLAQRIHLCCEVFQPINWKWGRTLFRDSALWQHHWKRYPTKNLRIISRGTYVSNGTKQVKQAEKSAMTPLKHFPCHVMCIPCNDLHTFVDSQCFMDLLKKSLSKFLSLLLNHFQLQIEKLIHA